MTCRAIASVGKQKDLPPLRAVFEYPGYLLGTFSRAVGCSLYQMQFTNKNPSRWGIYSTEVVVALLPWLVACSTLSHTTRGCREPRVVRLSVAPRISR